MEFFTDNMENITELIAINEMNMPLVSDCDIITASESFFHMDRTADFNVLIYVTDGEMYVTENGKDYEISAGELLFLKSGLRHFGKRETPRGTRWVYVHFSLPNTAPACEAFCIPKKICGLRESCTERKLYELCNIFHTAESMFRLRSNALLYQIFLDLCSGQKPESEGLSDKICDFLETQTQRNFSRELVTGHFYLSYSYLSAEFKKKKSVSMGQFHNEVRMKKACHLLRSTMQTIGEIAASLGFSDMLYFSRKFRAYTGVSPTDYRKQAQNRY